MPGDGTAQKRIAAIAIKSLMPGILASNPCSFERNGL
jgi:hypothetical protein